MDGRLLVSKGLEMLVWRACCRVVRFLDLLRDLAETTEAVREGTQGACEVARRLRSLLHRRLLVTHLVEFPEAGKALLSTEVRRG